MIKKQPGALGLPQRFAIDTDAIARGDVERRRGDHSAVDRDAPGRDPFLGLAARGEPGAGDDLGDALAGFVLVAIAVHSLPRER